MKKRLLLVTLLVFAITFSFASQISMFNWATGKSNAGIVYGANGPLAGVIVSAEPALEDGNGSGSAITDHSGFYTMTTGLVTGSYNVSAFAIGYIANMVGFVNVTAGETTPGVDIELQASGGISGTVTDAISGNPVNGTNLYAELSNGTSTYGWFGTTGTDGKYLIATNLVTGTYNVSVLFPPDGYFKQMTTANVVIGIETTDVNLQLPRSGIISGKVADPNGTGLVGVSVSAFSEDFSSFGSGTTDSSGNYRIATGLGTGNYSVYASGYGNYTAYGGLLSPTPVAVLAGQETSSIDIELTPVIIPPPQQSGTITGRVTDQSDNPISDAFVSATGSNGSGYASADSNGYFNISSGLGTGDDYNVSATASGYYPAFYSTLVSVTVNEVTPNINIQMTPVPPQTYGTITGTITGSLNPIIPEFQYPMMAVLFSMLFTAGSVLTLRARHRWKKDIQ